MQTFFKSPISIAFASFKSLPRIIPSPPNATFRPSIDNFNRAPDHARSLATKPQHTSSDELFITRAQHVAALKTLEATWYERLQSQEAMSLKRFRDERATWAKHFEKEAKRSAEIYAALTKSAKERSKSFTEAKLQFQRRVDDLFLKNQDLNLALLNERAQRKKELGILNLRGALEYIVERAEKETKIKGTNGVQQGLDKLSKLPEFTTVLIKEAAARDVNAIAVQACISHLYHIVSAHAHGNDGKIIVRAAEYSEIERAAFSTIFKVQSNWLYPLVWREDALKKTRS